MATLLLAAAGSALGGAVGGSVAGLGAMALGKAAGAIVGSALDQRLLGLGSAPVETGRVERFRVMGSSEGAPLARVFGRNRVAGQMIWSSRFLESVHSEQRRRQGRRRRHRARVQLLGQPRHRALRGRGVADRAHLGRRAGGRADGPDASGCIAGTEDQLPDPLIEAIEGAAPAYRGTAYVVFENLDLTPYGNRIPQFNFEVFRRPPAGLPGVPRPPALDVRGVALVPGCGEYALATEPVHFRRGKGDNVVLNVHNDRGVPDLVASLDQLSAELPNAKSVSLVVSWFGDDLRCDRCTLRPAVEQAGEDGDPMRWVVVGAGARRRARGEPGRRAADLRRHAGRRVGAAGDRPDEGGRAVGDVLSVHPDGHPGRQRADRSLDRRGRPAAGAVARPDHAGEGAGAAGLGRQDGGGGGGGGGVLRRGRGRRLRRVGATRSRTTGRRSGPIAGSSCTMRISARWRAGSMPSASGRRCAG